VVVVKQDLEMNNQPQKRLFLLQGVDFFRAVVVVVVVVYS
jgi:hypothetical protein